MEHTLVAVFDSDIHAQNALDELAVFGLARSDMHINAAQPGAMTDSASSGASGVAEDEQSIGDKIRAFFHDLFGGERDAGHADVYSEAVRRGSYVLTVLARDEVQIARATEVLNRHDPIDIEERTAQWMSTGWTAKTATSTGSDVSTAPSPASDDESKRSALLDQKLQAGNREGAGVRVFQRPIEEPVQESMPLREDAGASDLDFRTHWQSSYAQAGGRYEDYAPAYQFGSTLGMDERFRGRQWDEIEPQARTDWEMTHASSPWEKTKDAVRAGWDRVSSKLG